MARPAPGPAVPTTSHGYGALVGPGAAYAGVDQGIDFTGAFDVFALGDGIVTRVQRGGSGWPGEGAVVNYKITSGPAKGRYVYVAEDFAPHPSLRVGLPIKKGQVIGRATGSGRAPGIEVGWAQPNGRALAPRPAPRPAPQYTTLGDNFRQFVASGASTSAAGGGNVFTSAAGAANDAARHVPGVAQVEGAVGAVSSVGDFLGRITDPSYILRGLQIVAGAALVLVGVVLLARQVALAADLPTNLPGSVTTTANAVE